ncbi:winged helix-turn-helix domain-containing protein [Haploplasma modicum]|uniref:winged helix-turn-helix domain-containing protein n=1 Tax=Haploplasma modicum TaxID=2150 RepID=UPI00047B7288|nr:winged helix-turn-helix domain-containing protein [Haploplasma modicum]
MKNYGFFKPTPLYKEYLILELVSKNSEIKQREISKIVGASLAMINQYLSDYEEKGYLIRSYKSVKTVSYFLTDKGKERMRVLNIGYLGAAQYLYKQAVKESRIFIEKINKLGFKKIIFYGAGEVSEILLESIEDYQNKSFDVICVIDDDINKQGKKILKYNIYDNKLLNEIDHDAIIIASYTNYNNIFNKLINMGYEKEKILYFFE